MKDFREEEIVVGDSIAVIYHPQAYKFLIKAAKVTGLFGEVKKELRTVLDEDEQITPGYLPDETKERYKKVVKINKISVPEDYEGIVDSIGQPISVGDHIVITQKIELGNTLKGFEEAGIVTKLANGYAYFEKEGKEKKKKLNWVVVC